MKRLSTRERTLLGLLLVLTLVSGYILLFYLPMSDRIATVDGQIAQAENQLLEDQVKLAKLEQMRKELEEIFAQDKEPVSIATYDNLQAVMLSLNNILSATKSYTLNFGSVDTEEQIVRRNVSLQFSADDYQTAKQVLQALHDSRCRCMLDELQVSTQDGGGVSVSATMVFFEYQMT
jgi:competence protein ComGC